MSIRRHAVPLALALLLPPLSVRAQGPALGPVEDIPVIEVVPADEPLFRQTQAFPLPMPQPLPQLPQPRPLPQPLPQPLPPPPPETPFGSITGMPRPATEGTLRLVELAGASNLWLPLSELKCCGRSCGCNHDDGCPK